MSTEILEERYIQVAKCKDNLIAKNSKISPETATRICETLNYIFKNQQRDIPYIFESVLHKETKKYKDLLLRFGNLDVGGGRGRKTRRKIKRRRGRKPKSAKKKSHINL